MSDLTQALADKTVLETEAIIYDTAPSLVQRYLDAVSAARLVAEAPEVWWCETHQCTGSDLWCQAPERHWEDCEMVRKLLVDP